MRDTTIIDNFMVQYDKETWDRLQSCLTEEDIGFDEDSAHDEYMDEREEDIEDE